MNVQDKLYEQLAALTRLLALCHTLKVLERQQDDMDVLEGRAGSQLIQKQNCSSETLNFSPQGDSQTCLYLRALLTKPWGEVLTMVLKVRGVYNTWSPAESAQDRLKLQPSKH